MNGAPIDAEGWARWFVPFSMTHAVVVVVFAIITITVCRRVSRESVSGRRSFEIAFGMGGLCVSLLYALWWLLPWNFEPGRSLPLHVCDAMSFIAPLSLLAGTRQLASLAVFFGFAFCTQAFIKPLEGPGPFHAERWEQFWGFWLTHALIVLTSIYWVCVRGYRPGWHDFVRVSVVAWVYVSAVFVFNAAAGLNYVYVGRGTPTGETLADALGDWPGRVAWIALLGQAALAAVMAVRLIPGGERRSSIDSRA